MKSLSLTYHKRWGRLVYWRTNYVHIIYKCSRQPKRKWVDNEPTEYFYTLVNAENETVVTSEDELNKSCISAFAHLGESIPE